MGWGVGWQDRLRYRFDRLLARGSAATIIWVVGLAVFLALIGGVVFWALDLQFDGQRGPAESFWQAFLIAIGSGGILDDGWGPRLVTFTFVFAGVFLTGSLIGVLVAAVDKRVDELRRGRGRVLEAGHTVVVGWSPRLMSVIDELLAETPARRGVRVVVLADRDKQEMEDAFRSRHRGKERTRVLFRTGEPSSRADLELVGVDKARAVIVLSEGSFVDATAIRRSLAAHTVEPDDAHVVVEIGNPRVARSLSAATGGTVAVVSVDDVVADMLAQSIRRPHMARVFEQLLSYGGAELYVVPATHLDGLWFWAAARRLDEMALLGVVDERDQPRLLPADNPILRATDRLVVVAPEAGPPRPTEATFVPVAACEPEVQDAFAALVIGWNDAAGGVLDRLVDYLPSGSRVDVIADSTLLKPGIPDWSWPFDGSFTPTKHRPEHVIGVIGQSRPDVIVVLGYSDGMSHAEADALTLLTLMTLEQARSAGNVGDTRIVTQLYDRDLAPLADAHVAEGDFIVTDALASRLLVHASRNPSVAGVFGELFDATGPIVDLFDVGPGEVTYGSVVESLSKDGIAALGAVIDGSVVLAPPLGASLMLGTDDRIVAVRPSRLRDIELVIETDVMEPEVAPARPES
ncbi:MAG: NAD-binding protein [Acidimicrobiia bacterium]|nr:NAD-binding protein [Acidimicrobiia bacterium]